MIRRFLASNFLNLHNGFTMLKGLYLYCMKFHERLCIKMKKYVTALYFRNLIYISFGREKNQILKMAWKRHKNVPRSVIDLRLDLPFPSH